MQPKHFIIGIMLIIATATAASFIPSEIVLWLVTVVSVIVGIVLLVRNWTAFRYRSVWRWDWGSGLIALLIGFMFGLEAIRREYGTEGAALAALIVFAGYILLSRFIWSRGARER